MILVFDVETNGLPKNYQAPLDDFDNWPRAVQIAWCIFENNGELIDSHNFLVKPDGWTISPEAQAKNGITLEMCQERGEAIGAVLYELLGDVIEADYIVAHNIDFDRAILGSEALRGRFADRFVGKELICTMKESTEYCALGGKDGRYKWPKLSELYRVLFPGETIEHEHDALADTMACARCFFELVGRGVISIAAEPIIMIPGSTDIQKLAHARRVLEGLKATRNAMLETVTKDVIYIGLEKQIKDMQTLADTLEGQVREAGLAQYQVSKNKTPGTGWAVKIFKKVVVQEGIDLKEWCLHNFTPALKVDEKLFEKAAVVGGIPASVATVEDDPRVQIASDLSEFLPIEAPKDEEELPF